MFVLVSANSQMGSRLGYSYSYSFSLRKPNEMYKFHRFCHGVLFIELRIKFIIRCKDTEVNIDSERYDVIGVYADEDASSLAFHVSPRLREYWMSEDEINSFCCKAIAFVRQTAAQHANSLIQIPLVAHLEVCTVQQEGESFDATNDRAITTDKLTPLYLWQFQTVVRKSLTAELMDFLALLPRIRVEDTDEGLTLMRACPICLRRPCIGAQVSLLPCGCAFHSHCIIRKLENNNLCPRCDRPAYNRSFLDFPFLESDDEL